MTKTLKNFSRNYKLKEKYQFIYCLEKLLLFPLFMMMKMGVVLEKENGPPSLPPHSPSKIDQN